MKHVVIGGGVVGLAIGARLALEGPTAVLEKNRRCGDEISSRNSGVIHGGIYYPKKSLKTELCVRGKELLYGMCDRSAVEVRRCGKWIVSNSAQESAKLRQIADHMSSLGIEYKWLPAAEAMRAIPQLHCIDDVLESPTTGIVDVPSLVNHLRMLVEDRGGIVACNTEVQSITKRSDMYVVGTNDGEGVESSVVINAAGLHTEPITQMALGCVPADMRIHYCVGRYVGYSGLRLDRLVYPCPLPNLQGLGVHATIDMQGGVRFGPDAMYCDKNIVDYTMTAEQEAALVRLSSEAVRQYLPDVDSARMSVTMVGIRPKLSGPGEPARDFIIRREHGHGHPNYVSCVGIESPGLTASLSIADYVAGLLEYQRRDDHWLAG